MPDLTVLSVMPKRANVGNFDSFADRLPVSDQRNRRSSDDVFAPYVTG